VQAVSPRQSTTPHIDPPEQSVLHDVCPAQATSQLPPLEHAHAEVSPQASTAIAPGVGTGSGGPLDPHETTAQTKPRSERRVMGTRLSQIGIQPGLTNHAPCNFESRSPSFETRSPSLHPRIDTLETRCLRDPIEIARLRRPSQRMQSEFSSLHVRLARLQSLLKSDATRFDCEETSSAIQPRHCVRSRGRSSSEQTRFARYPTPNPGDVGAFAGKESRSRD
jgi:hypothetical protein